MLHAPCKNTHKVTVIPNYKLGFNLGITFSRFFLDYHYYHFYFADPYTLYDKIFNYNSCNAVLKVKNKCILKRTDC